MAKRTWDDVLKDRGFDPNKRKVQQAIKNSVSNINSTTPTAADVMQEARKQQVSKAAAIKALDTLNMLTLGNADKYIKPQQPHVFGPAIKQPTTQNAAIENDVEPASEPAKDTNENLSVIDKLKLYGDAIKKAFTGEVDVSDQRLPTVGNVASSVIKGEEIKMPETNTAPVIKNNIHFTKEELAKQLGVEDYSNDKTSNRSKYVDYLYRKFEYGPNDGKPADITIEQATQSPLFSDVKNSIKNGTNFGLYKFQRANSGAIKAWWESTKGTAKTLMGMMATQDPGKRPGEGLFADIIDTELSERKKKGAELFQKGAEDFMKSGEIRQNAIAGESPLTKVQFDVVQNIPDMAISAVIAMATGGVGTGATAAASQAAKSVATNTGKKALLKELAKKAGKALLITPETIPLTLKSFASSYQENLAKGMDDDKALTNALIKAYGEGLLEKGGVQSFVKAPEKGVAGWLASGGFEGSEEITQDMWSNIIDNLYGQKVPILTGDSFYSGLIGAITGWGVGAPMITSNISPGIKVDKDGIMSVQAEDGTAVQVDLNKLSSEQLEVISEDPVVKQDENVSKAIQNIYGNNALDKLDRAKADLLNLVANMPDTEVDQRKYETYREYIQEKVPEASAEQIDAAVNELRKMEIESPPAKGDTQRRIDYLVNKIKAELPQVNKEQDTIVPEQKPAEPRSIEDRIVSLKNARAQLTEGTPAYETISKQIADLEKELQPKETPAPADAGKVNIPETVEKSPTASEKEPVQKPAENQRKGQNKQSYNKGDKVTITEDGRTKTAEIIEIDGDTIITEVDGAPKQYSKSKFDEMLTGTSTESKAGTAQIDTSKYGRSGKSALDKWTKNEWINVDLSKPDNKRTQMWLQLFDKYYNLGRENKSMPRFDEQGELEAEFPPFIQDEIYRAGKADYEAQQKKEAKKAEKEKVPISESKTANVGYHAGDLGKAEHFARQYGSSRDTGHFGTGTYFVSNMKELESGSYKERPIHEVDLSGYNLFKPKNAAEAKKLHDLLKYINRYHNTAQKTLLTQEQIDDLRYAEPDRIIQELKNLGEFDNEDFEDAVGMTADEYIKSGQDNTEATHYLKKAIENLERTQKQIEKAKNEQKYFEEWADKLFGLPEGTAVKILNDVWNEISKQIEGVSSMDIMLGDIGKTDSASTRFMKALGYEGVDVRHIPEFDNTTYGTVVYDLREGEKAEPAKKEEKPSGANPKNGGIIEGDTPAAKIAEWVKQKLSSGERFTFADLTEIANEAFGGTQAEGKYIAKDAYDAMELGVNKYLLKQTDIDFTVDSAEQVKENVQKLRDLLDLIPTQTRMSEEQLQYQQFSTPPNIAYIVSWLANINENDVVLEPSAGIGGLAIFAKANDAKIIVNELSDRRLALLKNLQFDEYFNENAEQINNILGDKIKPTVVIMNPPFSATAGRMGDKRSTKFAKAHIEQALKILQPGGRLVAIVGQGMSSDSSTFRDWWSNIEKEYNVRANVGVYSKDQSGRIKHTDEYKKYGTTYGIQIIVIDKTGPTTSDVITANEPSLENIIDLLEGIRNDIGQRGTVQLGEAEQRTSKPVSEKDTGKSESGDMGELSLSVTGDEGSVSSVRADNGTSQVGTGSDTGRNAGYSEQESVQVADNTVRGGHSERSERRDTRGQTETDIRGSRGELEREPSVDVTDTRIKTEIKSESELEKELVEIEKESNAVYSKYIPQKVKIEGAKEHPSELVESAAMSAVAPPDPTYSPNLPENVIKDGLLSLPQLESVIYAGQAHSNILPDGTRKGFFIGDGTGVGKGRTIAGIIMDNFRQGRIKAVWVSENKKLFNDATRDWTGIGGNKDDLLDLSKFKISQSIERKSGILFTTYDTLKSESRDAGRVKQSEYDGTRLKQIVDWLGKDFDGVIIFDEAHNMASAVEYGRGLQKKKTSQKALAGLELQSLLPNARVVYASATGATDVHNLAYAPRLGLWGEGTPFKDVRDFIDQISSGGLAAMELIARDMKSMGSYLARNISFEGVEYETLQHDLSPIQREMYDKYCEAWQIVLNNINEALEITGQAKNSQKRSSIISQFWSNNQRFFNQVITSMAMPSVIQDIKNELKNGNSVIIQLVNTNEAAFNRAISNVSEKDVNLEDIDLSPTDILLQYIEKAFPVQQYEEYVDDNGKERSRPVYDSEGNPVLNKEAVAAKERLISDIKEMKLPDGALEIILDTFGPDQVAEVTGRTRRMIRKKDEKTGELKRVIEKWSESKSNADAKAFQDDKKRILVFSNAGSTGMSYHADRNAKNQQKRVHYLLQPGWNAIKATQGFGRSHRSNQVVAPKFKLVTTDLKGQKRFISTIARRLDQLGALTKGQRQAGSGIFSEKDNLEGSLASDTLQRFFRDLFQNSVARLELDGKKVLKDMGLYEYLTDEYGNYKDDATITRDTRRFLNRVLNLKYADQNAIFEAFYERMERNFQEALENGTLDVGLENYKAEKIVVKDEHVIRKDNTGAETKYLELTAYRKPAILMFDTLQNYDNFIGLYRNKETGEVRAVLRSANKTLENGEVTKTYRLLSPLYGKESKYIEKTLNEKMEEISKKEWHAAWLSEIEKLPEYTEENLHMLTGTLLPIWNKLPKGNMRIVRIVDDKGKAYLGRLIPEEQIAETLRRFSIAKDIKHDPADVFNKVLKEGYTVTFDNTPPMTMKRKKVSGEYRIELSGGNSWWYARRIPGIITEQIGYNRRYFIPVDERGSQIIAELMKDNNIKSVKKGIIETEDETSVQSFSSIDADMPKGDGSSVTSKTVDDLIKIIEKHTGVPIRTGKFRQRARGIFKVNPEVIRTKVRGDLPAIAHELGHYFDKKFEFSESVEFKGELNKLGAAASESGYSPKQIRAEGIAEFVRLYLTNPVLANEKAPLFMAHFEKSLDADTLKFLGMLRNEISAIKNLPNNKKIWNDISSGESRRSNKDSARLVDRFYDAWIDEDGPFARLQSYVEAKGWEGYNLAVMVKLYKGMASKVKSNLFYDQRDLDGNVIGDSLMKILEPLSPKEVKKRTGKRGNSVQEKKDFITYMVSRRAMDYKDRGLTMPRPWYVYEDNILAMEEKYPHFIDIFEGLREWEDNNLQLFVDAGLKRKSEIETIKFMNANHVPLYRIRDAIDSIRPGSGNKLGQSRDVLRRATGSGATIIDPLESMINDAFIIRRAAEANKIYNTLYEMSKLEGVGKMIEVIPPSGRTTLFTVEEIRGQMLKSADAEIEAIKGMESSEDQQKALKQAETYKEAIKNMSDEQLESVMSIYRPLYQEKDNQVVAYVDGKKVLMEVDPHLFRAIKGLNHQQASLIMRLLSKIKNVRVATIVTDMVFVLRNVARDFGTSLIQSEAGIKPWDILKGYISVAAKDKWYKEYLSTGGAIDFGNVYTRRQAQKIEDEVLQYTLPEKAAAFIEAMGECLNNNNARTRDKLKNAAKALIEIPIDMIRDAVEWSESGARVAEFRKAVEKLGVDKDTAASWGRKLSVDFLRHGYTAKEVNQVAAFFNTNLQGTARILETFKAHPVRTFIRGFVYITLPTMLLYAINGDDDDYQDLHEYRRALFYNIPIGGGKYIPIPKPPGWGWIFGAVPEFLMNKLLKDDPEAWEEIMSTLWQSFSLPTEITAVSPILDILANKSWSWAPIEGQYERQNKPAYLIRDSKTSLLANMIGDIAKNEKGLSPKQIDYLITQYLGNIGTTLWQLPDTIKAIKEAPTDVTNYPIIKAFITDAAFSTEAINDLYEIGEELNLRRKELMETGEYPAMSHHPIEKQKKLFVSLEAARAEYNEIAKLFEEARKAIKEIQEDESLTPAVKKLKERQIRLKMNKIARDFNSKYRQFKKDNDIK